MRTGAAALALIAVPALLAGCSSGDGEPDLQDGWDWQVRSSVAYDQDQDFDYLTGEVTSGAQGLRLRATTDPTAGDAQAAAVEQMCKRYVSEPYDEDDPYSDQRWALQDLLRSTWTAAASEIRSDAILEATRAIQDKIDAEPDLSLDDISVLDDEYLEVVKARSEREKELWASDYPDLTDAHEKFEAATKELHAQVYTEEMVRKAQQLYLDKCDFEVPDDYEFPTLEELQYELPVAD